MDSFKAPLDFLRQVRVELAKVAWPSKSQTIQLTMIVIIVTLIVGFFIGAVDYVLAQLAQVLIR